jgi:tRNA(Phe) wybutosine-synthesizing methylase Tyw3
MDLEITEQTLKWLHRELVKAAIAYNKRKTKRTKSKLFELKARLASLKREMYSILG